MLSPVDKNGALLIPIVIMYIWHRTSDDTHGRRATKKVTTNGSISLHQRYGIVLAGSSEVALGIIAIGTPEIASSVMGVIMTMHGADVISTGVKVIYTGELQSTETHRTITDIAVAAGADQDTASTIANGVEIAIGGNAVFGTKMTNCTKMLHVEMTGVRYTVVTRWGDELSPGKWVMKENPTVWNYLMSGKYQPGFSNQFAWPWQVHSYKVPCNTIQRPRGIFNTITKTPLGQRIYKP